MRLLLNTYPEAIEETVTIESIAQNIGMETVSQQLTIGSCWTQHTTYFVISKTREYLLQKLVAMRHKQAIGRGKAGDNAVTILQCIDVLVLQTRPVLAKR